MAVLSDTDRERVWRGLMRHWSQLFESIGDIDKTELRTAVNETDTWIENNQSSFNTALSDPFKTNATQAQKTLLFCVVAAMRVSPEFARKLLGDVD